MTITIPADPYVSGGGVAIDSAMYYRHLSYVRVTVAEGSEVQMHSNYPWLFDDNTATQEDFASSGRVHISASDYTYTLLDTGVIAPMLTTWPYSPNSVGFDANNPTTKDINDYAPPGHPHVSCGPSLPDKCVTYTGAVNVKIEPITVDFSATLNKAKYLPGDTAKLTATFAATVPGTDSRPTPYDPDSIFFAPANPAETGLEDRNWTGCLPSNPCTHFVRGAGNWAITAYVNGQYYDKSLEVKVAKLKLDVTPRAGAANMLTTFTAKWDDNQSLDPSLVTKWAWKADTLTGTTGHCGSGVSTCQQNVQESGSMTVWVSRNGVADSATAHVSIVPCPTTDSVLDNATVRQGLMNILNLSGSNLPPGDGLNNSPDSVGNKRERGGFIFQRQDGSYYFRVDTAGFATECVMNRGRARAFEEDSLNDRYVGHSHVHPSKKGQYVYGCQPSANDSGVIVLHPRGKWDTGSGRIPVRVPDPHKYGGGSGSDWIQAAGSGVDEYVINADGEVWHLSHTLTAASEQNANTRFWKYKGNSNSACNW